MSRHADSLTRSGPAVPTDMASRALRGGRESAVAEGASRLLAAKVAVMFQRAATWVRGAGEVAARELESVEALGELFLVGDSRARTPTNLRSSAMGPAPSPSPRCTPRPGTSSASGHSMAPERTI